MDCEVAGAGAIATLYAPLLTGRLVVTVLLVVDIIETKAEDKFVCQIEAPSGVTAEPRGFVPTGTVPMTVLVGRSITAVAPPKYSAT
jgi:hypothetical protein